MDLDLTDVFEIIGDLLDSVDLFGDSAADQDALPPERTARRSWWTRDDRADDDQ
jgi:hypothetical protein